MRCANINIVGVTVISAWLIAACSSRSPGAGDGGPDGGGSGAPVTVDWALSMRGTGWNHLNAFALDAGKNSYLGGQYFGSASLGDVTLTAENSVGSKTGYSMFVAKVGAAGKVVWAKTAGTGGTEDWVHALAVDQAGNVYLAGSIGGNARGPVASFGSIKLPFPETYWSGFLAKMDASGQFLWAKLIGPMAVGAALTVDAQGSVTMMGTFYSELKLGTVAWTVDRGACGLYCSHLFVARFDPAGEPVWVSGPQGSYSSTILEPEWQVYRTPASLVAEPTGTWLAGSFVGQAKFDQTSLDGGSQARAYLARVDPTGKFTTASMPAGEGTFATAMTMRGPGTLAIAGDFTGSAAFGATTLSASGSSDVFVLELDATGKVGWARALGGLGREDLANVAANSAGRLFVSGRYRGRTVLDGTTLAAQGDPDLFVAELDPAGKVLWASSPLRVLDEGYFSVSPRALAADSDGALYVAADHDHALKVGDFVLPDSNHTNPMILKLHR